MLYPLYTETKTVATGITWGTSKQTVSLKIPQCNKRLEGIMLEFVYTTAGTAPTLTSDGFANIAREIRLRCSDLIGARNVVQSGSAALLSHDRDNGGKTSRYNLFGERPVTAAKNYRVFVPVFVRPASIGEPIGNILSIPMDKLSEDMTLEIDIAPNSDCASANPSVSIPLIRAVIYYRECPSAVKYLPTELVTNTVTLTATGKQSYEIANGGFLSSLTLDCYSTANTVRSQLFTSNDHELQIAQGSINRRAIFPSHLETENDRQSGGGLISASPFFNPVAAIDTSGSDVLFSGRDLGHYCFDFLFDWTLGGALSPASMLNCNTIALGGDKVKVTGTNFSTAGTILVTHHKFLTRSVADLQALIGA